MNAVLLLSLITTCVLSAAGMTILALTTAGIRREERRLSLPADPGSPVDALARRVLGAHVSLPGAQRILTARHSLPPARRLTRWPSCIGSQAIPGPFSADELPVRATMSGEVDILPIADRNEETARE